MIDYNNENAINKPLDEIDSEIKQFKECEDK